MKTALLSVLTATLLGFASLASGRSFDAADFTVIIFTTGLVAWTIEQYSRVPRALARSRSVIHLTAPMQTSSVAVTTRRLAA